MKRPTAASLKKVTAANLEALGAERLAQILLDAAGARADLKRRLRMELAAHQGAEPLSAEIDKRLISLATSRGKVGWRQRATFVRDLDGLRALISAQLAGLDRSAATERLWRLMRSAPEILRRLSDKDGLAMAVFGRAAEDLGGLITEEDVRASAEALIASIATSSAGWAEWLPRLLAPAPRALAERALILMRERRRSVQEWPILFRQLASAADDVDAFATSYTSDALVTPAVAADVASRYLARGRLEEAGDLLKGAAPKPAGRQIKPPAPDFAWETVWIDYLSRSGEDDAAQAVRWASFERTLHADRLRAFTAQLADFEDVEAEGRAFEYAARHPNFEAALRFLIEWPALFEAGGLILSRADEVVAEPDDAELWAAKLRARQPAAAHLLLRKAAAAAFRRREFKICDRLSAEADAITAI